MIKNNEPENNSGSMPHSSTLSTNVPEKNKEQHSGKRNWFSSLTRRRKTQSQSSLNTTANTSTAELQNNNNNDNVDSLRCIGAATEATAAALEGQSTTSSGRSCKRKEEKNVFQRIRKKMGLHLYSLRRQKHNDDVFMDDGATTDASAEFLTHSPTREPQQLPSLGYNQQNSILEEREMVPFTLQYKRFVAKKWLERDEVPNRVMHKASSEMLGQVWYWGEISRRDAQKQLTDKPTGSFLVRDSETSGSQFTLSFRIAKVTLHYRLEYRDSYWHFEELQYESIVDMIEDILFRCTNDNLVCFVRVPNEMQPPFPVILKYPLSRYLKMPQLQDLCRRVIQRHITDEEIAKLPIPPKLQEYLSEKRELVF